MLPRLLISFVTVWLIIGLPLPIKSKSLLVNQQMSPPAWALMERELLRLNSEACELFANKYLDKNGYLLHVPRWGTLDGPDDAIETFHNWTLLHALGGSERVLELFKLALEGHLKQYSALRTVKTDLARHGAYHDEFITMSDWFHTGEGMRGFMFQGLSEPASKKLIKRMKRFAGLYMNEDPEAPNYDPKHKIIRSLWNGSKGPLLKKATTYDWVGDPVVGRFHLLHSPHGASKFLDFEKYYPKMLAHCSEYLDSIGDHPLNLASTNLALNSYMLTQEKKYSDWIVEYVNAWKKRTELNRGNIPTNIGLNGKIGGEYGGRWYKGTYGWNFTIFDGEIEKIAHRNTFSAGMWPGFGNAFLLTGNPAYINTLRRQISNLYAQKKLVRGQVMIPQMFGDPRGYQYTGQERWYHWTNNLFTDRLLEIYLWSMDRNDLKHLPKTGWLNYLEGGNPNYPEQTLQNDFKYIRNVILAIKNDPTTPKTRLADWLLSFNPAKTDNLVNLMLGGSLAGRIWTLHTRVRYFDPVNKRAGLPEDVATLVEKLTKDSLTLTLVNTNQIHPHEVIIQAGAYGEHLFNSVTVGNQEISIKQSSLLVRLDPGCGAQMVFNMKRYVNQPTLSPPWQ